jgi:hypothetical protein
MFSRKRSKGWRNSAIALRTTYGIYPTRNCQRDSRKKLIFQLKPVSTEQLRHLAGSIITLTNELDSMCKKAFNEWRPGPRGMPPPS